MQGCWARPSSFTLVVAATLAAFCQQPSQRPPILQGPRESITVRGEAPPAEQVAAAASSVPPAQVKQLPADPATVRDALPLVPGVVRTPEGRLRISGTGEHRSLLLVNSFDVTDAATGKFGATVPIDSVAVFSVYKSPFLAEYGRFTGGVVAVETCRGGDQWRWELNDPTPEFRIRSRHIRGVRGFTPRLSFSGPLAARRLYLSQSVEYALNKTPVFTLQFPRNERKREAWNSLTQLDYAASGAHLLTLTLHGVPERINFANLDFYNPQPATPSYRGHEYRAAVTDRLTLGGGLLESGLSFGRTRGRTGAQGDEEFTLTPTGNLGNYFASQDRRAERTQWLETYSLTSGPHRLKFGGSLIRTTARGDTAARPVNVRDLERRLLNRIEFANHGPFRLSDWELGLFAQDHWELASRLALDAGLRADWQQLSGVLRLAPRAALSWSPFNADTILRAGYGWFYDRVPLNVYAFERYPGHNVLAARDFAPRSRTWNAQVEHRLSPVLRVRVGWLQSRSSRLPVLAPEGGAVELNGRGRSAYRQLEIISKLSWEKDRQVFVSYVHSRARGNLNEFDEFLGDFPAPLIRPDVYAEAPAAIPHRFLAWGVIPITGLWRVAPVIEYRTGFPYTALDAAQNYAGTPNSRRFPNFFSVDLRIARDIHYRNHGFQVSFSVFNLTNHWNPDTVRLNVADPQFGEFLGQHKRRFRLDFDFLF